MFAQVKQAELAYTGNKWGQLQSGCHHTWCSCHVTFSFLLPTFPSPGCLGPASRECLAPVARTGSLMSSAANSPGTARKVVYQHLNPLTGTWENVRHVLCPLWLQGLLCRIEPQTAMVDCSVPTCSTLLASLPILHLEFLISTLLTSPRQRKTSRLRRHKTLVERCSA